MCGSIWAMIPTSTVVVISCTPNVISSIGGRGDDTSLFDHLNPIVGIVGSSNFTGPGLISNRELNLVHKTLLEESEIDDPEARGAVSHHAISRLHTSLTSENQRFLKSEVG